MTWRIVYVNGSEEMTPGGVDKLTPRPTEGLLYAYSTRTYGADELITTYVMSNIRKWEKV